MGLTLHRDSGILKVVRSIENTIRRTSLLLADYRGPAVVLACTLGLLAGVGGYTFIYAEGPSYLGSDPKVCINCHIMQPQYDAWQKSSHHKAATCVDCHLPHGIVGKYIAKGENGYHHSKAFTLQDFHEPILIKTGNSRILRENCIACHEAMVDDMLETAHSGAGEVDCVHCHRTVGHGEPTGLGGPLREKRITVSGKEHAR
jgi:cytochrome c nitrite reductase small subunit